MNIANQDSNHQPNRILSWRIQTHESNRIVNWRIMTRKSNHQSNRQSNRIVIQINQITKLITS
jgi:hypothetical protein